jgi:hypothetical protein
MRRTMLIRPLSAVGVLSVSALVFTACGSSSKSAGPSAQAGALKPAERISDFAKRFAAAAAAA